MTDLEKLLAFAMRREGFDLETIAREFKVGTQTIQILFMTLPEIEVPREISPENLIVHLEIIKRKYAPKN